MKFDLDIFGDELKSNEAPLAIYDAESDRYRMIPASVDPLVIEDAVWQPIVETSQIILKGMNALIALWQQPALKKRSETIFSELSPFERASLQRPDRPTLATARFDLFFDGEREGLKIIEANTTIPAMQAYSDIIRRSWLRASGHDDQRAPNTEDLLQSLLFLYRKNGGGELHPRIAIVARAGDSQMSELKFLKSHWEKQGYETRIVLPGDLKISAGRLIDRSSGVICDLIYRHIFASRLDQASDFAQALLQNQSFHIYNPIAAPLEVKALFAELNHFAGSPELASQIGLAENERQMLKRYMPWTRILKTTATPEEREEWKSLPAADCVIKGSSGYGGHSVFIGSEFHRLESQSRLHKLMKRSGIITWPEFIDFCSSESNGIWIIQRRLQGRRMKHRFFYDNVSEQESYVDASIFAWSHSVPRGGASRFALDPIVNLGRGGGLLPMFLRSEYDLLFKP